MLASANVLAKAVNSIQEVELTKCSLTIYQVPIRNKYFQQQQKTEVDRTQTIQVKRSFKFDYRASTSSL